MGESDNFRTLVDAINGLERAIRDDIAERQRCTCPRSATEHYANCPQANRWLTDHV